MGYLSSVKPKRGWSPARRHGRARVGDNGKSAPCLPTPLEGDKFFYRVQVVAERRKKKKQCEDGKQGPLRKGTPNARELVPHPAEKQAKEKGGPRPQGRSIQRERKSKSSFPRTSLYANPISTSFPSPDPVPMFCVDLRFRPKKKKWK